MIKRDIETLWEFFLSTRDKTTRADLISHYSHLHIITAKKLFPIVRRSSPLIEIGDLKNIAFVGLLEAIDAFRPNRGAKFKTFAIFVMRQRIFHESRRGFAHLHGELPCDDCLPEPTADALGSFFGKALSPVEAEYTLARFEKLVANEIEGPKLAKNAGVSHEKLAELVKRIREDFLQHSKQIPPGAA